MATLNNLSVTANILQVVGFADTVFRVGQSLYEVIDTARQASRNIALLLHQLQALLSVVALVNIFLAEHQSSSFALDDGHVLPNIQTLLLLIEQDFRHLKGILGEGSRSTRAGWLASLQTGLWWALKDKDIADARHRLSQYTQQLTAALSATGRRNDIVFRNKLQNIEDTLHTMSRINMPEPLSLKSSNSPFTGSHGKSTCGSKPKQRKRVEFQRSVMPKNSSGVSSKTVCASRSEQLIIRVEHPKISIYEQADQTLVIETGNYTLHDIAKGLFLLRDSFIACLGGQINHIVSISAAQADDLGMLFDTLTAAAHDSSAHSIMRRYHQQPESHTYTGGTRIDLNKFRALRNQNQNKSISNSAEKGIFGYLIEQTLTMETTVGSVKARILSTRQKKAATTLGFVFDYTGSPTLGLSPFTVHYVSHAVVQYTSIQVTHQKWDQKNLVCLDDALGRKIYVPPDLYVTPDAFHYFLEKLYDGFPGRDKVLKHQYILDDADGQRIVPSNWYERVVPGQKITMSMVFVQAGIPHPTPGYQHARGIALQWLDPRQNLRGIYLRRETYPVLLNRLSISIVPGVELITTTLLDHGHMHPSGSFHTSRNGRL